MEKRRYEEVAPWITFHHQSTFNELWAKLGEAYSKNVHLAGTPLQPSVADRLSAVYMRRGALASTAIEGNTLTEDEVNAIKDSGLRLPRSQQYLQREVDNILKAISLIDESGRNGTVFRLTPEWIRRQNAIVFEKLEVEDHVVPGEYTTRQLVVGTYKAAPPEDADYLMDRLCQWINGSYLEPADELPEDREDQRFFMYFLAAVLSHLYIAWIHPFGDGNGRTARLVEVAILAHSQVVPWLSSNLLSDYYNRTRTGYYSKLQAASQRGDIDGFVLYSAVGFVEQLRGQIDTVRKVQREVSWVNFVHEKMHDEPSGKVKDRRRDLVLEMSRGGAQALTRKQLRVLTTELAIQYANEERMLSRDLTRLIQLRLVDQPRRGVYQASIRTIDSFLPLQQSQARAGAGG